MLAQDVKHLVAATFPNRKVARTELLPGGLINTNLKIYFESDFNPVVLRLYRDGGAALRQRDRGSQSHSSTRSGSRDLVCGK